MEAKTRKAKWAKEIGRQVEEAVLSAFLARGYDLVARNFLVHQCANWI